MQDVAGKAAVVTGGASGIGRGMAEVFAAAGMKLVIADVDGARAAEVARVLEKTGAEAIAVRTDVANPVDVGPAIRQRCKNLLEERDPTSPNDTRR